MSTSQKRSTEAAEQTVALRPITFGKGEGPPYTRRTEVDEEIKRVISISPSKWTSGEAVRLKSETIVYLIRLWVGQGERESIGPLVDAISRHISRIVADNAKGFDETTLDEIALQVGLDVLALILANSLNRQAEFLEVAFRPAVQRRTLNQVEKRHRHPKAHEVVELDREIGTSSSRRGSYKDTLDDDGPTPQEAEIRTEEVREALAAISDPRHREAVVLRYLQGWPTTDDDPAIPTLTTHFEVSARTISTWINKAIAQMRDAIGE